jgi:hypothetical protein
MQIEHVSPGHALPRPILTRVDARREGCGGHNFFYSNACFAIGFGIETALPLASIYSKPCSPRPLQAGGFALSGGFLCCGAVLCFERLPKTVDDLFIDAAV